MCACTTFGTASLIGRQFHADRHNNPARFIGFLLALEVLGLMMFSQVSDRRLWLGLDSKMFRNHGRMHLGDLLQEQTKDGYEQGDRPLKAPSKFVPYTGAVGCILTLAAIQKTIPAPLTR